MVLPESGELQPAQPPGSYAYDIAPVTKKC